MDLRSPTFRSVSSVAALLGLTLGLACASDPPPQTGFLGDYSRLRPGRGNEAQLIYIDPGTSFAGYDRVVLDRVTVWRPDSGRFAGVGPEDRQWLADTLESAFRENMAPDFTITKVAPTLPTAAGALRIRLGITAARGGRSGVGEPFLGMVAVEVEVLDAASGKRLAAAVDTRTADPGETAGEREVRALFQEWAAQARNRLAALRAFDAEHWTAEGS